MMGMKEYVRPEDGYHIRVTEKAYKLFYRRQGFVPAIPKSEKAVLSKSNKEAAPEHDTDAEPESDTEAVSEQDMDAESDSGKEPASESDAEPKKKRTKKAPADGK